MTWRNHMIKLTVPTRCATTFAPRTFMLFSVSPHGWCSLRPLDGRSCIIHVKVSTLSHAVPPAQTRIAQG